MLIDIQKAYDKTWGDAVWHPLWKSGIRLKIWKNAKQMNRINFTKIITKFGPTEKFEIKNNLKQGSVLSFNEFTCMMDKLSRCLLEEELGAQYGDLLIPALLYMDDIAILENRKDRKDTRNCRNI